MTCELFQIGVLIEDKELVDSFMGGKPWKAGKFCLSLRLSLWSEHLGLRSREVSNSTVYFPVNMNMNYRSITCQALNASNITQLILYSLTIISSLRSIK